MLEVDVFEVAVEQIPYVSRSGFLVETSSLDAVRVERSIRLFDHLVKHVRCWQFIPGCRSVAVIFRQEIIASANGSTTLRLQEGLVCPLSKCLI